ncbi:MAG: glutamate 5-kinase [Candidatus Omnitrophota bacterium]|nr:MAG: glutamate 5-kinase [Candidatus Omnitrophota bacterium]
MQEFTHIKRVVIKVGTRVLSKEGRLEEQQIKEIGEQIKYLLNRKIKVVLVSSGAIAAGLGMLGLKRKKGFLPFQQGLAAIGQVELMNRYKHSLQPYLSAQILLTREDLNQRQRYLNVRHTLSILWEWGVVPIINENDSVSTEEIKFGDNDLLASLVASLVNAQLLLILSDVEGFYSEGRKVVSVVERITPAIERMVFEQEEGLSKGGMASKLQAAKIATRAGIPTLIANGREKGIVKQIIEGRKKGTLFLAQKKLPARKSWIAFSSLPSGEVIVDKGAKEALLKKGKSLLSSGIVGTKGRFKVGDVVSIIDENGEEIGRGLVNYSQEEVEKIKGLQSREIERRLGYRYYEEVIHRDNLYCSESEESK